MTGSSRKLIRSISEEIDGSGFGISKIEQRSKHLLLVIENGSGESFRVVAARTPSDWRNMKNIIALIRRNIRNAGR